MYMYTVCARFELVDLEYLSRLQCLPTTAYVVIDISSVPVEIMLRSMNTDEHAHIIAVHRDE